MSALARCVRRALFGTSLVAAGVAGVAGAQGLQKSDAPIELKARPALAAPGAAVTLSGTSVPMKDAPVSLSIKPPQGAAQTVAARPGADGTFSVTFKDTKALGRYDITATAPDGKAKVQASFLVGSPGAATQALETQLKATLVAVAQAQAVGDALVASLPPSPAQLEVQKKSALLKTKLADGPAAMDQLGKTLDAVGQVVQKYPETIQAVQPLYDQLADETKQLEEQTQQIKDRVAKSKAQGVRCDTLDAANEAFNAVSFGLDLAKLPSDLVKNFVIDKGPGPVIDITSAKTGVALSDNTKAGIIEGFKTATTLATGGIAGGPLAWASAAIGVANDLAQFVVSKLFAKFCDKYEGPMDAQFRVELRTDSEAYLQYLVQIQGKLVLRYAKAEPGSTSQAVAVNGQIEGNAIAFKAWEAAYLLDPRIKTKVLARLLYPPLGTPYVESAGTIARAASPGNFYIPVHGELVNGKLKLQIDAARNDFSDLVKVRLYYVFVDPMLPIPQIVKVELPVQKAFFIFDRGMHSKPEFDVKTDSTASTIENTFKRDETVDSGQVRVEWVVHVKACNPGCLPIRA